MKTDSIFFVVSRKPFNEPLVPQFLFGDYTRGTESRRYSSGIPNNDVARISKNIVKSPKIFGSLDWIVDETLKASLSEMVDVKWRNVEIAEPFRFEWHEKDGFELFDEFHDMEMRECLASGKSEHECDSALTTDPDLAYAKFVDRYLIDDFEPTTNYFELVAESAYHAKQVQYDDTVAMAHDHGTVVFSERKSASEDLFSLTSLNRFGILSLSYGKHAVTSEVFPILQDYIETEYYDVLSIATDVVRSLR